MVLFSGRKVLEKIVVELLLVGNCLLESVFQNHANRNRLVIQNFLFSNIWRLASLSSEADLGER